jgi:hypothetical protein
MYFYGKENKKIIKDLKYSVEKAQDEKSNLEIKYNGLLDKERKREKEEGKNKIDEIKLLFIKINTLDDKFNFLSNEFKINMDTLNKVVGDLTSDFEKRISGVTGLLEQSRDILKGNEESLKLLENNDREIREDLKQALYYDESQGQSTQYETDNEQGQEDDAYAENNDTEDNEHIVEQVEQQVTQEIQQLPEETQVEENIGIQPTQPVLDVQPQDDDAIQSMIQSVRQELMQSHEQQPVPAPAPVVPAHEQYNISLDAPEDDLSMEDFLNEGQKPSVDDIKLGVEDLKTEIKL